MKTENNNGQGKSLFDLGGAFVKQQELNDGEENNEKYSNIDDEIIVITYKRKKMNLSEEDIKFMLENEIKALQDTQFQSIQHLSTSIEKINYSDELLEKLNLLKKELDETQKLAEAVLFHKKD